MKSSAKVKKRALSPGAFLVDELKRRWQLYLMLVLPLAYLIIFCYVPMGGVIIAFKDYSIRGGIWGSDWVGFKHFINFFNTPDFFKLLRNTLILSLYNLVITFPMPIILALAVNELKSKAYKKVVQMVTYLPYFISIVVVVSILQDFTSADGVLTQLAAALGDTGGALWSRPEWFRTLYIGSNIWQHLGYNSIIFISALAAIDQELYEAAVIDGAGRWKQTLYITLPELSSTIVVLLILRLGQIMNVGYEKTILMYSPATYETADVIASYVYRVGIEDADYGYSTAINFFNSVVNFLVLFVANAISRKLSETSLW